MASSRVSVFFKWFTRILLGFLLLIIFSIALSKLPVIQNRIITFTQAYISDKIGTRVTIEEISITFAGRLAVRGLHIPDQTGRDLLNLQLLTVGIDMSSLIKKEIQIKNIAIIDAALNLSPFQDNVMNYQFLIDAFATEPGEEESVHQDKFEGDGSSWNFGMEGADLFLENCIFRILQPDSTLNMIYEVGRLRVNTKKIDLRTGIFDFKGAYLGNASIDLFVRSTPFSQEEDITTLINYLVSLDQLILENINVNLVMDDFEIETDLDLVKLTGVQSQLREDTTEIKIAESNFDGSRYRMDIQSNPHKPGFDFSHMDLDSIEINISNFNYCNQDISGEIHHLVARDHSGFVLSDFRSKIHYSPDSIELWNVNAHTPYSKMIAQHAKLTFPYLYDSTQLEETSIDVIMDDGELSFKDLANFLPHWKEYNLLNLHKEDIWSLKAQIHGKLADLRISLLESSIPGLFASVNGRIQNLTNPEQLAIDAKLSLLQAKGLVFENWLPKAILPEYIDFPKQLKLSGDVHGSLHNLDLYATAATMRNDKDVAGSFSIQANIRNLIERERLVYHLNIDTLAANRQELSAYLPNELKSDTRLADQLSLSGSIWGSLDTIHNDILLKLYRGKSHSKIQLSGRVENFTNAESMSFEQSFDSLFLLSEELAEYIPDSILPDYIDLPDLISGMGTIKGTMHDFAPELTLGLPCGDVLVRLSYRDSAYHTKLELSDFNLPGLFTNSVAYDSVFGLNLPRFSLKLDLSGNGLDINNDLEAHVSAQLLFHGKESLNWTEGMILEGVINRKSFVGKIIAEEKELNLNLNVLADLNAGKDTMEITGSISKIDFHGLTMTTEQAEFLVQRFAISGKGTSFDSLSYSLIADNLEMLYDSISESSLQLKGFIRNGPSTKIPRFYVYCDFLAFVAIDQAGFPELFQEGRQELVEKLQTHESTLRLNQDPSKNVFLALEVIRPDFFTSGIVPGLTELDSIGIFVTANTQDTSIALYGDMAHLKYKDLIVDSFQLAALNWDEFTAITTYVKELKIYDKINARGLKLDGATSPRLDSRIILNLSQEDSTQTKRFGDSQRFNITAFLDPLEQKTYKLTFQEKQIINYDSTWVFEPKNQIVYKDGQLSVSDLTLSNKVQSLSINEISPQNFLVDFNNFELGFFSDIIKLDSDLLTGILNGQATIRDPLDEATLIANLEISQFGFMNSEMGDLTIQAEKQKSGLWESHLKMQGEENDLAIIGRYNSDAPITDQLQFSVKAAPLQLQSISPIFDGNLDHLNGKIFADLQIEGSISKPALIGDLYLDGTQFRPLAIGTPLEIQTGHITFDGSSMKSSGEILVVDSLGQQAGLQLKLETEDYIDYVLDGSIKAENFLLLDLEASENYIFHGQLFTDLDIAFGGSTSESIKVKCNFTPRRNSSLVYVYDQQLMKNDENSGEGIVEFVNFENTNRVPEESNPPLPEKDFKWEVTLNAEVTKDLDLMVIMDRNSGDYLKGKAKGDLSFNYFSDGKMELTGLLDVSDSRYLYTYQQVAKREFVLQEGSTITFIGPIYDPQINLIAGYSTRTTPYALIANFGNIDLSKQGNDRDRLRMRQEFQVSMNVTGTLNEAALSADVTYPRIVGNTNADLIEPALANLRSNSSEMNTQALSLILFNTFHHSGGDDEGKSMINLKQQVGDVLTSQLNYLTEKYVNFVDVNFGLETLSDAGTNLDLEDINFRVGLKKRFLDGRLIVEIDGIANTFEQDPNSESNQTNMQTFLENAAVEYFLTKDGVLRVALYNKYTHDDIIGKNVIKLGSQLVFSKDFDLKIFKTSKQRAKIVEPLHTKKGSRKKK